MNDRATAMTEQAGPRTPAWTANVRGSTRPGRAEPRVVLTESAEFGRWLSGPTTRSWLDHLRGAVHGAKEAARGVKG